MTSLPSPAPAARCELIIFDFDGTLADSFGAFLEAMEDAVKVFKYRSIPREELPALRQKSAREIMKLLGVRWWQLPRLARYLRQRLTASIDQIQLFPGIAPLLEELAASGLRLVLVTSNSEENVRLVLGPKLAALFESYECGTSLFGKASRFRRVQRRLKIPQERILCIGDELRDAEAARAAGLPFGAVTWGYADTSTLEKAGPARRFSQPKDIRRILRSESLAKWLCASIPGNAEYLDLANLSLHLFCLVENVPVELREAARSKENLADAFAALTRQRYGAEFGQKDCAHYGACHHRPTEPDHWIEVMMSVLKLARKPDDAKAAQLLKRTQHTPAHLT